MWFRETPIGRLGQTHPAQKNDKKNVHEEPYFRSLSVSNNWPSQARSEAHKLILNPPNHHKSQSLDTKISIQSVTNMTPLHCVFTLSLFWWPEPLKYINGWVFLLKGLGLQRTTLWDSGSFWRRSQLLLINWRAPVTGTISVNFCTGCRCRNPGARFSLCSVLAFFLGCPSGSSMRNYVIDSAIVIFEKQCLQTISFNLDLNLNFRSEDRIGGFPQRVRG